MTHRVFSRNSSSSRAIPVNKLIEQVVADPAMPVYWGQNKKGMQADEEVSNTHVNAAIQCWLGARDEAVATAKYLANLGLHKQIVNRVLEPWMWITVIITATEYDNFFKLRCHKDAQPEIKRIAEMMKDCYVFNTPTLLKDGEWHLPFITDIEACSYKIETLLSMASARSARVSYLTHDGVASVERDSSLANDLANDGHWSPFEHPAKSMPGKMYGNFNGFQQYRKFFVGEDGLQCQTRVL
jgi:Thymidylate synthase complementing protein